MFLCFCLLSISTVISDTHVERKVSVKEVVFDSPVADIIWLEPGNRTVLARSHNGMFLEWPIP
jgi:hypothetical protein